MVWLASECSGAQRRGIEDGAKNLFRMGASVSSGRRKELTAAQARKVIAEMVAISSGEVMSFHSAESWLNNWLANKAGSASVRTMERYRQVIRDFLAHLGPRAKASIASISPGDLINFRDKLREEGRSAYTCNTVVKRVLNIPFEAARKLGFITVNPVTTVDSLRDRGAKLGREPFTSAELVRLLEVAEGDWRGAILLGVTTGLRLGDTTRLYWESVDLSAGFLRLETAKTGTTVVLPIHDDLTRWLSDRPRGIGKAPVFPELARTRLSGATGLSAQFRNLVEKAGITGRVVTREGKGRATNSKTFHALRHSFISALANAGVASRSARSWQDTRTQRSTQTIPITNCKRFVARLRSFRVWGRHEGDDSEKAELLLRRGEGKRGRINSKKMECDPPG